MRRGIATFTPTPIVDCEVDELTIILFIKSDKQFS
jgi:hypothetical protein